MLIKAEKLHRLDFSKLMEIYVEANMEHGAELWPEEPEMRQIALSERDFYSYLHDDFFTHPGACYYVWMEGDRYCAALRVEPFKDGKLLEALETAPELRGRGYASALIRAVQKELSEGGPVRLYSHVSKTNIASLRTHEVCGFRAHLDHAVYVDGTANRRAVTLLWEKS